MWHYRSQDNGPKPRLQKVSHAAGVWRATGVGALGGKFRSKSVAFFEYRGQPSLSLAAAARRGGAAGRRLSRVVWKCLYSTPSRGPKTHELSQTLSWRNARLRSPMDPRLLRQRRRVYFFACVDIAQQLLHSIALQASPLGSLSRAEGGVSRWRQRLPPPLRGPVRRPGARDPTMCMRVRPLQGGSLGRRRCGENGVGPRGGAPRVASSGQHAESPPRPPRPPRGPVRHTGARDPTMCMRVRPLHGGSLGRRRCGENGVGPRGA